MPKEAFPGGSAGILRKIIIPVLFFILIFEPVFAQNHHWIFFRDKGPEAREGLRHPERVLSPMAIENRRKGNIPFTEGDLPISETYLDQLKNTGLKVVSTSRWLNAVCVETELDFEVIQQYCPSAIAMRPVGTLIRTSVTDIQLANHDKPGPTTSPGRYGLATPQNEMIGIQYLHDLGFKGQGVRIGIFDAGFKGLDSLSSFSKLWQKGQVKEWYDFVDRDTLLFSEDDHGLHVLSTIGANMPAKMVGTAPSSDFLLARTETIYSESRQEENNWVSAVEWADSLGVDVIHSSLGYSTFDNEAENYFYKNLDGKTALITRTAAEAARRGILVVTSAGNEGWSAWKYITAPCDADSVLCVGAITSEKKKASFSSVGPTADGRIKPDVVALGQMTAVINEQGNVSFSNGTSYSAPIIAGLAACLRQAHPQQGPVEIIQAIRLSSNQAGRPDSIFGYGLPNARLADEILLKKDSLLLANDSLGKFQMIDHFRFEMIPNGKGVAIRNLSGRYFPEAIEVGEKIFKLKSKGKPILVSEKYFTSGENTITLILDENTRFSKALELELP